MELSYLNKLLKKYFNQEFVELTEQEVISEIKTTEQILEESKIHRDFYDNLESLSEARKNQKWIRFPELRINTSKGKRKS